MTKRSLRGVDLTAILPPCLGAAKFIHAEVNAP